MRSILSSDPTLSIVTPQNTSTGRDPYLLRPDSNGGFNWCLDANQIGPPSIQYQQSVECMCSFFVEDPQIETLQIHQKFIPTIAFQNWLWTKIHLPFSLHHDRNLQLLCLISTISLLTSDPIVELVPWMLPHLMSVLRRYVWMVPPRTRPHILRIEFHDFQGSGGMHSFSDHGSSYWCVGFWAIGSLSEVVKKLQELLHDLFFVIVFFFLIVLQGIVITVTNIIDLVLHITAQLNYQ